MADETEPAIAGERPATPMAAEDHARLARIAAGVAGLSSLDSRPLAEHAEAYVTVHADLQGALAEIDSA